MDEIEGHDCYLEAALLAGIQTWCGTGLETECSTYAFS